MAIFIAAHAVYSVSKRKLKDPPKPKDQGQHLTLSYEEIKSKMPNFQTKDFAEVATGHRRIFVLFNSNADAEGLRAMRGFYGAFQRLSQKELNVTWGVVDCDTDRAMCQSQDVHFSPQYWLYINKRRVNYTAGRSPFLVSEWLYKTIAYPGVFIDRRSQLKRYEDTQDRFYFYIGYMDSDYDFFKEIAASYPYYLWISCFDRDRMMHANGVYWYEQTERAQDMRNGPMGELVMQNFTLKYFNILRSVSNWTLERIFHHDRAAVFIFYPDTNEERGIQMPFWSAAMDFKWEILNCQVPIHLNKSTVVHLMEFLGVTNPESSAVRILALKNGKWEIYQMRERINTDALLKFFADWKKGKLPQFYKSDKPAEHKIGEVRKVVSKNFEKYVYNHEVDAVVVFHVPSCTVCDRILKIAKIAVQVLGRYEDIRIFEVDCWKNSGEDIPYSHLPQMKLYKKHDKLNPIHFTGLYTAKDLIAWISEQVGKENPFEEEIGQKLRDRQREKKAGGGTPNEDI